MSTDPNPPRTPWWVAWPVGARVVVRRSLPEGGYSDTVGELLSTDADGVLIRSRKRGDVYIAADVIAVGKVI